MPTGYTALIENGKISTGKEFLTLCLRAFGIACHMREEPLDVPCPRKFEYDPQYVEDIKYAKKHLDGVVYKTIDEFRKEEEERNAKQVKSAYEQLPIYQEKQHWLDQIRAEIEKWNPPTEEHQGIKEFALNQIDMSSYGPIIDYYKERIDRKIDLSDEAINKIRSDVISSAQDSLVRAKEREIEHIQSIDAANAFLNAFFESLDQLN